MSYGITHLDLGSRLDTGNDVAHIAAAHFFGRAEPHLEDTYLVSHILLSRIEELDLVAGMDNAVLDLIVRDDAPERVEDRVENQCLERSLRVACRSRNLFHDGIQKRRHTLTSPCRNMIHLLRLAAEQLANLISHHIRPGSIHIYLVQNRDNLKAMLNRLIQVRNRLSLNTLRSIHHQQSPLTGSDGTGHLV